MSPTTRAQGRAPSRVASQKEGVRNVSFLPPLLAGRGGSSSQALPSKELEKQLCQSLCLAHTKHCVPQQHRRRGEGRRGQKISMEDEKKVRKEKARFACSRIFGSLLRKHPLTYQTLSSGLIPKRHLKPVST